MKRAPYGSTAERYVAFYSGEPTATGCIEWVGPFNKYGYGVAHTATVPERQAHRLAYSVVHGPIPPGVVIRHSCDNPPCVNVEHLLPGTPQDNMRDMAERGRARKRQPGEPCLAAGHDMTDPANVLIRKKDGVELCRACARAAQARWREKRKAEDPEGYLRAHREEVARYRAKGQSSYE